MARGNSGSEWLLCCSSAFFSHLFCSSFLAARRSNFSCRVHHTNTTCILYVMKGILCIILQALGVEYNFGTIYLDYTTSHQHSKWKFINKDNMTALQHTAIMCGIGYGSQCCLSFYVSIPTCNLFLFFVYHWAVSIHAAFFVSFVYQWAVFLHHTLSFF